MNGLDYRLMEFLPTSGKPALLFDTSAGLSLGALPGLEDFGSAVRPILSLVDGVVCSPGQLRRLENRTRNDAALLVRMDWTNTLRDAAFPLPPEMAIQINLLDAGDAVALGAAGMVTTFLLGYEETVEAGCQKAVVQLALSGKAFGIPLLVEVRTSGPRVSLPGKAVELGASYALEGGADGVIIPYPGPTSLKTIASMVNSIPWFLKCTSTGTVFSEWEEASRLGAAGLWLDHAWLAPGVQLIQAVECVRSVSNRQVENG